MKQLESEQQFESLKQGATVFEFTAGSGVQIVE